MQRARPTDSPRVGQGGMDNVFVTLRSTWLGAEGKAEGWAGLTPAECCPFCSAASLCLLPRVVSAVSMATVPVRSISWVCSRNPS